MSHEQPSSPTLSSFQCHHRRSSSDSVYSCDLSNTHAGSPLGLIPQLRFNSSESSLSSYHSITSSARYPDSFNAKPSLPLRGPRANERFADPPTLQPRAAPPALPPRRKPIPTLTDLMSRPMEPQHGIFEAELSLVVPRPRPIAQVFNPQARWSTADSDDVASMYTCPTSPPSPRTTTAAQKRTRTDNSPGAHPLHFTFGTRVTDVKADVNCGPNAGRILHASKNASTTSQDSDKPGKLEQVPWPNMPPSASGLQRKRPAPIYVGDQVQRSTTNAAQIDVSVSLRSSEEIVPPETNLPTDKERASPRQVKNSDASHFSLSMFPPTPTSPLNSDFVRAALNSAKRMSFGLDPDPNRNRHSLNVPRAGLLPPLVSPIHLHRSAPNTPVRRATTEVERQPAHYGQNPTGMAVGGQQRLGVVPPTSGRRTLDIVLPQPSLVSPRLSAEHRASVNSRSQRPLPSPQPQDSGSSKYSIDEGGMLQVVNPGVGTRTTTQESPSTLPCLRDLGLGGTTPRLSIDFGLHRLSIGPETPLDTTVTSSIAFPDYGWGRRASLVPPVPPAQLAPPSPARKPVPRLSMYSDYKVAREPESPPTSSVCGIQLKSLKSISSRGSVQSLRKRAKGKIVISHPHLNTDEALGAEVLPSGTNLAALAVGAGIAHSRTLTQSKGVPAPWLKEATAPSTPQRKPKPPFDRHGMPNEQQLRLASEMFVYDQLGIPIRFGDIFKGQKTAVCFIRHFWCPLCQDYMSSIVHLTEPSLVAKAGVKLVIIGNGSPAMIRAYREDIFNCPYEMYTDPSREVYNALGMHLRTTDGGSNEEKGSYVKHGTFTGTMMVLKNALKMPLANAGDIKQLGGEFVLGPGLTCSFTSRMHTTRSHTPIRDLLQAAGVDTNPWATDLSFIRSEADQARWMDLQNEDLDRLIRRGLQASCGEQFCALDDNANGANELDLGEFRRLVERLKEEAPSSRLSQAPRLDVPLERDPELELASPTPVLAPSYVIEVKDLQRVELDHLGAVLQSRNGSGTWEAFRSRKMSVPRLGAGSS